MSACPLLVVDVVVVGWDEDGGRGESQSVMEPQLISNVPLPLCQPFLRLDWFHHIFGSTRLYSFFISPLPP